MTSPSIKRLEEGLDLSHENAKKLKWLMATADTHDAVDAALDFANDILDECGVESRTSQDAWDAYYCDIVALYVNNGETYQITLLFDVGRYRFYLMSWGDFVEISERTRRYTFE